MKAHEGTQKVGKVRGDERKYYFTQHIFKLWNSLPQEVAAAAHLNGFKRGLGMEVKLITDY